MKREDCYFYMKYLDMGAYIPICSLYKTMGKCPCENCNRFLSKIEASQIINKYLGGELVERPKGKWIENKGKDIRDKFYICSKCGRTINIICGDTLENYPFCHCGAKMESEG